MLKKPIFDCAFNFDQIFIKLAGNQDRYKISVKFEFGPFGNIRIGVTSPLVPKNPIFDLVQRIATSFFYRIFVMHAGNEGKHKILDEFDFGPDRNIHFGVTHP